MKDINLIIDDKFQWDETNIYLDFNKCMSYEQQILWLKNKITENEKNKKEIEEQIKNFEKLKEDLINKLKAEGITYDDTELRNKIKELKERVETLNNFDDTELRNKIRTLQEEIANLPKPKEYNDTELKSKIKELKERVDNLPTIKNYDSEISDLRIKLNALENRVNNLPNSSYNDTELRNKITALSTRIDNLPKAKNYDTEVSEIKASINDLKQRINNLSSQGYDDTDLRSKIAALSTRIDNLPTYNDADIKREIQQLKEKDVTLNERINGIKEYNDTEIRSEITDIKAKIEQLKTNGKVYDDTELRNKISELKNRVDNITTGNVDLEPLKSEINTIKSSLETLKQSLLQNGNTEMSLDEAVEFLKNKAIVNIRYIIEGRDEGHPVIKSLSQLDNNKNSEYEDALSNKDEEKINEFLKYLNNGYMIGDSLISDVSNSIFIDNPKNEYITCRNIKKYIVNNLDNQLNYNLKYFININKKVQEKSLSLYDIKKALVPIDFQDLFFKEMFASFLAKENVLNSKQYETILSTKLLEGRYIIFETSFNINDLTVHDFRYINEEELTEVKQKLISMFGEQVETGRYYKYDNTILFGFKDFSLYKQAVIL